MIAAATGLAVVALWAGCEWQGGGSADHFSDRYNWVNFSGVYRGVNGGRLVTDYTSTPGTEGLDQYQRELVATLDGTTTVYQGVLKYKIIAEGSVTVTGPNGLAWNDDGSGVLVSQSAGGIDGTINYVTGAWRVEVAPPVPTGKLVITYVWIGDGTQIGISRPGSGATAEIYTFTVTQEGNQLTILDNNGATYTGKFGSVSTTGGQNRDTPMGIIGVPAAGGDVIAQFSASGVSAAGKEVSMVGTFQAQIASSDPDTGAVTLSNRMMFGTWIEKNGRTGDINGLASPITTQQQP